MQRAKFLTRERFGIIEIAYLEEKPSEVEGPFLAEERSLIDSLAGLLQSYFERLHAEEDRVRLVRAEVAASEAREATRAKDQFLATLSHEFRAPLNVMLGWTKMLLSGQLDQEATTRGLNVLDRSVQTPSSSDRGSPRRLSYCYGQVAPGATPNRLRIGGRRGGRGGPRRRPHEKDRAQDGIRSLIALDGRRSRTVAADRLESADERAQVHAQPMGQWRFAPTGSGTAGRIVVRDNGIGMPPELVPWSSSAFARVTVRRRSLRIRALDWAWRS